MIGRKPHHLVLCGSLALTALTGCQDHSYGHSTSPSPTPLPTEIVTIFVGGQCRVAASTIVCRDSSRSEPQNRRDCNAGRQRRRSEKRDSAKVRA